MKVVLFKRKTFSPVSWAISWVTKSKYVHAGVLFWEHLGDLIVDSSESRGYVGTHKPLKEFGRREVLIYNIPGEHKEALEEAKRLMGTRYDWDGIWGWIFKKHNKKKLYCFEFVLKLLTKIDSTKRAVNIVDIIKGRMDGNISAKDIIYVMSKLNLQPQYKGPANKYKNKS